MSTRSSSSSWPCPTTRSPASPASSGCTAARRWSTPAGSSAPRSSRRRWRPGPRPARSIRWSRSPTTTGPSRPARRDHRDRGRRPARCDLLAELAEAIGAVPVRLAPGSKAAYHAAAVLAAGGFVALLDAIARARRAWRASTRAGALAIYLPLSSRPWATPGRSASTPRSPGRSSRGDAGTLERAPGGARHHAPDALDAAIARAARAGDRARRAAWRRSTPEAAARARGRHLRSGPDAVRCGHAAQHRREVRGPSGGAVRPPVRPGPRAPARAPSQRHAFRRCAGRAGPCCASPDLGPLAALRAPWRAIRPRPTAARRSAAGSRPGRGLPLDALGSPGRDRRARAAPRRGAAEAGRPPPPPAASSSGTEGTGSSSSCGSPAARARRRDLDPAQGHARRRRDDRGRPRSARWARRPGSRSRSSRRFDSIEYWFVQSRHAHPQDRPLLPDGPRPAATWRATTTSSTRSAGWPSTRRPRLLTFETERALVAARRASWPPIAVGSASAEHRPGRERRRDRSDDAAHAPRDAAARHGTRRSAPGSSTSAAGRCPSSTRASSTSTAPCASAPACSTCRTWASCGSRARRPAPASPRALVTDPPPLAVGRAHYSMICAADGGIIDDLIVYRLAEERFLVVPNASNAQVVSRRARGAPRGPRRASSTTARCATSLVAVQGPRAAEILAAAHRRRPRRAPLLRDRRGPRWPGMPALVARTGYTGEDGFELFVDVERGRRLWDALAEAGRAARRWRRSASGARDTLRLEAGMPLYGNELDRDTNPFEAGLGRVVKLDKAGDFVGRAALEKVAARGPAKQLVGLVVRGPRHRPSRLPGPRGRATAPAWSPAGTMSPTLGTPIAMAYVAPGDAEPGTMLEVEIRDAARPGRGRRRCRSTSGRLTRRALAPTRAASRSTPRRLRRSPAVRRRDDAQEVAAMVPADLRYTKDHEWVRVEGDEATVGITAVRGGPAGRRRLRGAARGRAGPSSSSRRSASSSRSRP